MARHLSSLPREYMCKFPGLHDYLTERPEVNGYALIDDVMLCGVILLDKNRIHYVFVPEESRRGGYGTELVGYAINSITDKRYGVMARVEPNNQIGLSFMVSCGFDIIGWSIGPNNIKGYLLDYKREKTPSIPMDTDRMAAAVLEMTDKLLVVETLPVNYTRK